MLNEAQVRQYREQGFCIARGFLQDSAVQGLLKELDEITAGATVAHHDKTKMEMEPDQEPGRGRVRRVYEPCDHYPHYRELSEAPHLLDSVQQLIGPDVVFHYSKLNMKPARIGSPVEWHQDLAYYPLTNPDSVTILFYLDDADSKTGCLMVMPEMHQKPLLDHTEGGYFSGRIMEPLDESKAVELEGPAGSAIFMQCTTPHSSKPNHSPNSRRTLILSYRASDAYPIYMGEMTVKGEGLVRLVRGHDSPIARFAFSQIPIPKYRRSTSSIYDLQEESRKLHEKGELGSAVEKGSIVLEDTYGHTAYRKAIEQGDVYGIAPDPERQSRSRVRLGIIGAGGVAQSKYLPAIARLQTLWEPVQVTAFAEPSEVQGRKVEALCGARWYANYETMLAQEDLDGLLVLGPDHLHAEHTIAGLERKLPVLVEKPISRSLSQAESMCRAAEAKGIPLMTVAMKRYSPPYRRAKEILSSGAMANPAMFVAKFNLGYDYVDLFESGTIHVFDLARFFMGDVLNLSALAVNRYRRSKYPLDNAVMTFEFLDQSIGSIYTSCSALSFKPWERVEIYGDHAWLAIEDQNELILYDSETGPVKSWRPVMTNTLLFDEEFLGYMGQVENFLQVIRKKEEPFVTGRDGFKALELAVAAHLSLARRSPVSLPLSTKQADEELRAWFKDQGTTVPGEK